MKVLMTADAVGGVWTYVLELCTALAAHDVEVSVVTMGPRPSDAQRDSAREASNVTLVETDFALEWMDDPWRDVARAGEWLLDRERRERPDVVHLNGFAFGALPFRAPTVVVAHSCVLSWWEAVRREEAPPRYDPYRAAVRRGLGGADAVVAPSQAMLDAVERHHGLVAHGRVIANGRDPERFRPGVKQPVVVAAGRVWDEAKNIEALDRVASDVPWPVRVAGDTRGPVGIERPLRHATALGPLAPQALAAELARASVFVLPARYEPFGLSALEAALSGCALVLGDIASLRELWDGAALFVSPDDDAALGTALAALAADDGHRACLADEARRRALTLTPRRMAADYLKLYRSLAPVRPMEVPACVS